MGNLKLKGGIPDTFDLEQKYQHYLKLVGIKEEDLGVDPKREIRRAFFGAAGIMLVMMRTDLSVLPSKVAVKTLEQMERQVANFWNDENLKQNGQGN